MTTDLIAALFGHVTMEEPAARELAGDLERAADRLGEAARTLQELADSCDESEGERELADRFEGEADACEAVAEELGEWSGSIRGVLTVPPDQRQAIY